MMPILMKIIICANLMVECASRNPSVIFKGHIHRQNIGRLIVNETRIINKAKAAGKSRSLEGILALNNGRLSKREKPSSKPP